MSEPAANQECFRRRRVLGENRRTARAAGLLTDIQARLINVVVVSKVDRLTRSLTDFAKMSEVSDDHSVSFVAITQQSNSIISTRRLTLLP